MGLFGLFGKKKEQTSTVPAAPKAPEMSVKSSSQPVAEMPQMPASFNEKPNSMELPSFSSSNGESHSMELPEIPSFEPSSFASKSEAPMMMQQQMDSTAHMSMEVPNDEMQHEEVAVEGPKFVDEESYGTIVQNIQIVKEEITQISQFCTSAIEMEKKLDQSYDQYQQLVSQMTKKMMDIEKSLFSGEKA